MPDTPLNAQPDTQHTEYSPTVFDRWVVRIGNLIAVFYIIAVFITVYELIVRRVFNAPTIWVFEINILLIGCAMLYGGAYCMSNDGHIRVSVITDLLPPGIQRILRVIVALLTLLFMLSLCYAAWFLLEKALFAPDGTFSPERQDSQFKSLMPSAIKLMLFIVVVLMAVQSLLQLMQACARLFKGEKAHG